MTNAAIQFDFFYGDLTVNRGYVYARVPRIESSGEWSLAGQVRGPRCLLSQTLPVSAKMIDQGSGPTLLARALIADPAFWTPDLPAIYDVTVDLLRGGEIVGSARHELGLRPLGVRGKFLSLEGKRWVLRGVHALSTISTLPRHWHDAAAGYVAPDTAADDRFVEASQFGALAVALVAGPADSTVQRLRMLGRFPAVAIVVLDRLPADVQPRQLAPNLLFAQRMHPLQELDVQPWAQLLWLENAEPAAAGQLVASTALPIIVSRPLREPLPLAEARAACDALQRELAPVGQFAGYVV